MSNVTHVPIFRINISPSAGIKNSIDNNTTSRNISSEHGNFTLDGRINSTTYDWHLWNASDLKVEVVGDALVKLATWHGHVTLSAARNPTYFKRLYRLGPYTRYSFLTNRLIFTDKSRYFASKNPLYFPYVFIYSLRAENLYTPIFVYNLSSVNTALNTLEKKKRKMEDGQRILHPNKRTQPTSNTARTTISPYLSRVPHSSNKDSIMNRTRVSPIGSRFERGGDSGTRASGIVLLVGRQTFRDRFHPRDGRL